MKNFILKLVVILFVSVFAANTSYSQTEAEKPVAPRASVEMRAERMTNHLRYNLKLTEEQTPKVKEILLAQEKQKDADIGKYSENKEEIEKANKKRSEVTEAELAKVLTTEQMSEYKKMWVRPSESQPKQTGAQSK